MNEKFDQPISVIEIRRAKNGFVISAFTDRSYDDHTGPRGYTTRVVQSDDPDDVGKGVALLLCECAITSDICIPAARTLP